MLKSQVYKTIPYPDDFTEDDKLEYDLLYNQAKILHNDVYEREPFIIHTAIIGHIRAKKGMEQPFTDEELEAVKQSYILKSKVVECKGDEHPYLYDKENNPMFFPSKVILTDGNREVVVEQQ